MLITATPVLAGNSGSVGGPGGSNFNANCSGDSYRLSGLQVKQESSGKRLVTRVRGRCTSMAADGSWANSTHNYTGWTNSARPSAGFPSTSTKSALCDTNRWVGGVDGDTGVYNFNEVLMRVRARCFQATATGTRTGSASVKSAGSRGVDKPAKDCPGSEIAYGIAGRSAWYLDSIKVRCKAGGAAPAQAPELVFPINVSNKNTASPGNSVVSLNGVTGATKYNICVANAGQSNCWYGQMVNKSSAYANGNKLQFAYEIPPNKAGTKARWRAAACNSDNLCGPWSGWAEFGIVPKAPNLSSPANNSTANPGNVTFSWQAQQGVNSGYQLFIYRSNTPSNKRYKISHPTDFDPNYMYNVTVNAGTSKQVNIPSNLGNNLKWAVTGCVNLQGLGRECSQGYAPRNLTMTAPGGSRGGGNQFSWQTYDITSADKNTYSLPQGSVGYNIKEVVTGNIVIRNDGKTCISCHSGGAGGFTLSSSTSRSTFCNVVSIFVAASKPQNLDNFFQNWKNRACPN